jgi:hypothetical protein
MVLKVSASPEGVSEQNSANQSFFQSASAEDTPPVAVEVDSESYIPDINYLETA